MDWNMLLNLFFSFQSDFFFLVQVFPFFFFFFLNMLVVKLEILLLILLYWSFAFQVPARYMNNIDFRWRTLNVLKGGVTSICKKVAESLPAEDPQIGKEVIWR
ncbi:hypothetical protein ACH5RR_030743 [Cinchona calisaya]|uniref:Uncharacterized protein n=1 Tax=Cinchona calisaya TaxID=153742 RepID=A0ABD2YYP2_9GENT